MKRSNTKVKSLLSFPVDIHDQSRR